MKGTNTAIIDKQGVFKHLGISPITSSVYGYENKDILTVEIEAIEDQSIQSSVDQSKNEGPDYWAWWDSEDKKFTYMYPQRFLLNMIFPYGMEAAEEKGNGKGYRVKVKLVDGK